MLNERSFSEILEEIETDNPIDTHSINATTKINAGWETLLEPAHLATLLGHVSTFQTTSTRAHKAYPVRPRPSHLLDQEQMIAFTTLASQASQLKDNFNSRELRSAYRLAVLKTHPDQGGTAESFQAVKKSYQILLVLVTK